MADLTRREKVYESVVHARIDACYLLSREFARSHGYNLDFEDATHVTADTSFISLPIVSQELDTSENQRLKLKAGSVEFVRLTTDTTLFQVFIGDPLWSLVASVSDQDGTAAIVKQARQAAPDYVEAVWLGILGRFRSLNLVATHRITSSQSQPI
jgi:hypothetical protein